MISSVIVFLYALGIMTDLYDSLYSTMMNPADLTQTTVPGSIVYYNMQEFNSVFLKYSIGLILLACLLYITNTHIRRKYYIGNYVAAALFVIANVTCGVTGYLLIGWLPLLPRNNPFPVMMKVESKTVQSSFGERPSESCPVPA